MQLVPGTLTVKVYRAEDLPQMDAAYFEKVKKFLHVGSGDKDKVDPYCSVSFAGHRGHTKAISHEENPEWNKQINIGARVR